MTPTLIEAVGALLFALAIIHTFSVRIFERLAHTHPDHSGVFHLLGEVEAVFGFWAMVLVTVIALVSGTGVATEYLDTRNFTEPMFVFAVMVVAGSRAILQLARTLVEHAARLLPVPRGVATYVVTLAMVPLLGSVITEPAAMTLGALMLRDRVFATSASRHLRYVTLGVLFVNVSIGGTLTPFAAPPVLMVAGPWQWDMAFMLQQFGWRAAVATAVNAVGAAVVFRRELQRLPDVRVHESAPMTVPMVMVHALFLAGIVASAHHPPVFMGLFLFFMGLATAYPQYQDRLILREGLLVALFLAGLVVLGGMQRWWLEPLLATMSASTAYYGAMALTAITDNAAITYLGSQVSGLTGEFKVALVAGAVTGGGLTVIANAPNPAGVAILRDCFEDQVISPLGLLGAALVPTGVAVLAFRFL